MQALAAVGNATEPDEPAHQRRLVAGKLEGGSTTPITVSLSGLHLYACKHAPTR